MFEWLKKYWLIVVVWVVVVVIMTWIIWHYVGLNNALDFILFVIGVSGIIVIGCYSYKRMGWEKEKNWIPVPVALIAAFVAIPLIGVNYNLKKGTLPLAKMSIGNCEICFNTCVQKEVHSLRSTRTGCLQEELPIKNGFKNICWQKEYQETLNHIQQCQLEDLLDLCCSCSPDEFLKTLYDRNKQEIQSKIIPLIEKINCSDISNDLKKHIIELQIFDCIGLETFKRTIAVQVQALQEECVCRNRNNKENCSSTTQGNCPK